jgi:hypothetical protein
MSDDDLMTVDTHGGPFYFPKPDQTGEDTYRWVLDQRSVDLFDKIPACGCSEGWMIYPAYLDVLRRCADFDLPRREDEVGCIVLGVLDSLDLIEHGSNIRWSWPTMEGDHLLAMLTVAEGCEWNVDVVTA